MKLNIISIYCNIFSFFQEAHHSNPHKIQRSGSKNDPVSCILNTNTVINNVMLNRESLHEQKRMLNIVPSRNNFPHPGLPEANNRIVLNYNHKNLGAEAECYMPVQIKLPVNLLSLQMPNMHVLGQNQSTYLALPSSNSYKQSFIHTQSQISQKGPIKVVDMKKLLQPPQEDARTKSTNKPDCEIVKVVVHNKEKMASKPSVNDKNKTKLQTNSTNTNMNVTVSSQNVPSKVAVSQVLDCLKVILPVKFDLSRLIPNDKVAALVIRYLKLQDDSATKSSVTMYLRIIVDAAKVKEKTASTDIQHPYLKINDIALQLALEKVLPPKFVMTDVSNLVLNCLCIVLNQDVYLDGYHILRKLIRKRINEGQHCNDISIQESDMNNLIRRKGTGDKKEEKQPLKKLKLSVSNKNASRMEKTHPPKKSLYNTLVKRDNKLQSSNQISLSKQKSVNSSFTRELVNNGKGRLKMQGETLESKLLVESLKSNKSINGTPTSNSNNKLERIKEKMNRKGRVKLEDEEWEIESSSSCESNLKLNDKDWEIESVSSCEDNSKSKDKDWKIRRKSSFKANSKPKRKRSELEDAENLKEITSFLEKQQYTAKDVLNNLRRMFHLCRFLNIKSRQCNIQKLNESLNLIIQMKRNKKSSRINEDKINPELRPTKQKVTLNKSLIENCSYNKLKLKPVVVLRDLIDYETEDMLFMKGKKTHSRYFHQQKSYCNQHNLSTKKYSSDHVNKLTCESYKMFRRIVVKKLGKKIVFRLKYSKLSPGSLVFVKDFRHPSVGWLKGSINKLVDSLNYAVELSNGEIWWCAPEQLRPLPLTETEKPDSSVSPRSPRVIKPRQLFDL